MSFDEQDGKKTQWNLILFSMKVNIPGVGEVQTFCLCLPKVSMFSKNRDFLHNVVPYSDCALNFHMAAMAALLRTCWPEQGW